MKDQHLQKWQAQNLLIRWVLPFFFLFLYQSSYSQWVIPAIPGLGPNSAVSLGANCFQMTNGGAQRGVIWNANTLDLNNPFDIEFMVNFDVWGADGLAFVLQNAGTSATGAGANALGYGDAIPPDVSYSAITQSIAFELDTWDNFAAGIDDIAADHVAIHQNGNTTVALAGPIAALTSSADVTDNVCRRMRVTWNPVTTLVEVYFQGIMRLSTNINLIGGIFGGNPIVYWGFTASSGGIPMTIEICTDVSFANAGPDRNVCFGDTLQLSAGTGASYLWNFGPPTLSNAAISNPIFSGNVIGPVQLELAVTNAIGCVDLDTAIITVEPRPTALAGGPFSQCLGDSVTLGGPSNPNYSYLWSPAGPMDNAAVAMPRFSATIIGPNAVQLIVTDNSTSLGCRDTASTTVTVLDTPSVSISANFPAICPGQNATLTAIASGGGPYSYLWNNAMTTAAIVVNSPGIYSVVVTGGNSCTTSNAFNLAAFPAPSPNLGNDTTVCVGQNVNLNAGAGYSNYAWNSGASTQNYVATVAGPFSVTVTDGNGCLGSDTVMVANFPEPNVFVGPDTAICFGDSLRLNATAGFTSYLWNTGTSTASLMAIAAGNYAVTVTDLNGCLASDTMNLTWNPPPSPNLGPDIVSCTGSSTNLDAGAGFSSYLWSTGQTSQTILVAAPGNYDVTVTDANGCQGSDTLTFIWQGSLPVDLGNDSTICVGDTLNLDAGFAGSTFLWSTGETMQQIAVWQSGSYSVTVTDLSGCSGIDTFNLSLAPIPIVQLGADTTICTGDSLLLDAGNVGSSYAWTTGAVTQQILAANAGIYGVSLVDLAGCMASDSITINLQPLPMPNLGPDLSFCAGSSALLSAGTVGNTYLWSNGSTNNALLVQTAGSFWIRVTDSLNCKGSDTVNVAESPLPNVSFSNLAANYCLLDSANMLLGIPAGGNFSANVGTGFFDPLGVGLGSHLVTYDFTDSLGCANSDSQFTNVVAPPSAAIAGPDLTGNGPFSLMANNPIVGIGHWENLNGSGSFANPNAAATQFTAAGSGSIEIVWIVENAPCPENRDTLLITAEGLLIPSGFSPNGDGVNDLFVIRGLENYPEAKLSIFNRWGERVWEKENYRNDWTGKNSANQDLSDDTYFYVLEYAGKSNSNFVVLKR